MGTSKVAQETSYFVDVCNFKLTFINKEMRGTEGSVDLMTIDLISFYNLMKSLCKKQNDARCRGVQVAEHVRYWMSGMPGESRQLHMSFPPTSLPYPVKT